MREEMISYPLAVLAKEKGFREPTIYYYDQSEDLCSGASRAEWNGKSKVLLSAPTQCLLQRWLRENHNLHIWIETANNNGEWRFNIISVILNDTSNVHYEPETLYSSYESVLNDALIHALKFMSFHP